MTSQPKRRNPSGTARRRWVITGLVLLLLLDVVLVIWALGPPGNDAAASAPAPASGTSTAAESTPTPSPTPVPPAITAPQGRLIAAIDDSSAWRATTADCASGEVVVERTTTGGATWTEVDLAASVEVAAVTALRADDSYVSLIAEGAEDCTPTLAGSYTGGEYWQEFPTQLSGTWHLGTANRSVVTTPAGERPAPCDSAIALADTSTAEAALLCADQSVFRTVDGGSTWDAGAVLPGAVAVTADGEDYLVARIGVEPCAGVQLTAVGVSSDSAATERGCSAAPVDASATTAISSAEGVLWLWSGDTVLRSTDGGGAWE